MRIAFMGASGTGKTTLVKHLTQTTNLVSNPIGSRSVAKAMGYDNPYDVDAAGKREEFQRRLLSDKLAWEGTQPSFVVDRTPFDNLAYTVLHDVHCVDQQMIADAVKGMGRYTHIYYCPLAAFHDLADDPLRQKDMSYHYVYEALLRGLLMQHTTIPWQMLAEGELGARKKCLTEMVEANERARLRG